MARGNDSWGIEVGAHAIKAVRLTRSGKDVHLEDYEVLPFKQVLTTPDINVDEAIQVNLDALMQKHDLGRSTVVISVPGHLAFARFAKLPPVEPKKIPDIVRFEAVQQIPFPIDQVEWDYQVFQQQDSPDVEVGIFAITKERVMNYLSNYRQVGMRVDALTLSPLAVYNSFAYENQGEAGESAPGTIYMDIGTQSTDVIIVENGGIWLRTLPIGGNNFTDALVKAFKLSFAKAEKLKREAGTSKYARQIFQAMRPVFADLVQEMQRSLGYYQSLNRDAELTRLVGVGSTFRLPGLQKFLKQQLQMEVVRPEGFKRITVDGKDEADFADNALNMATAYGLALQGVGLESVTANVLPQHILRQRMWKAKQPWIAAAAACIAVASGAAAGRYFVDNAAFEDARSDSDPIITPVLSKAQNHRSELQNKLTEAGGDPRLRIENLRRILDYRDLWPKILDDVAEASKALDPQPVLATTNYVQIRQMPPQTRRRFYIQNVNAEYKVAPDTGADAAMASAMGQGAAPGLPPDALSGSFTTETFFAQGAPPPRFVITVTGYTPYGNSASDAVRLISQQFIGYLQQVGDRADRPYRVNVDPRTAIVRQFPIQVNAATGTPGLPGSSNRFRGSRGTLPRQAPRGLPNRGFQGQGMFFDDPGMMDGMGGGQPLANQELIPLRPLSDEQIRATGFEIRWTVELLRPDEARRAEGRRPGSQQRPAQPAPEAPAPAAETPPQAAAPQQPATDHEQEVSL